MSMFSILDVTYAYTEPHRAYHVLSHPVGMIELGNKVFEGGLTVEEVLAIWYHDFVYVAGSKTNEQESAIIFRETFWKANPWTLNVPLVEEIILCTKDHLPVIGDAKRVIDLDLIGLSDSRNNYRLNAVNVRKEYCEFSDDEWVVGRTKFLEKMLGREQIYFTDYFKPYELNARHNMEHELKILTHENPIGALLFYRP